MLSATGETASGGVVPPLGVAQAQGLLAWILYYHLLIFFTSARTLFSGLKLSS